MLAKKLVLAALAAASIGVPAVAMAQDYGHDGYDRGYGRAYEDNHGRDGGDRAYRGYGGDRRYSGDDRGYWRYHRHHHWWAWRRPW